MIFLYLLICIILLFFLSKKITDNRIKSLLKKLREPTTKEKEIIASNICQTYLEKITLESVRFLIAEKNNRIFNPMAVVHLKKIHYIVVNKLLIHRQFKGALCHEFGHIYHNHKSGYYYDVYRAFMRLSTATLCCVFSLCVMHTLLAYVLNSIIFISFFYMFFLTHPTYFIYCFFSRRNERQADDFVRKYGLGRDLAKELLSIRTRTNLDRKRFLTHPPIKQRIKSLK